MVESGTVADGHTLVINTVDNFISHSLITSSVFGPQREIVDYGTQYT